MLTRREFNGRELPRVRRVLIVDDDEDAALLLERAISSQGHQTQVAHDPLRALALANEFGPQVAILDIELPGMSGFELARTLRKDARFNDCRFVAVTGHGLPMHHAHEAPIFNAHLRKPVNLKKLQSLVLELDHFEAMGLTC